MAAITHPHPVPERSNGLLALPRISLWPLIGLAVLIAIVVVFAFRGPPSERTVRTADGTVWTVSDISAYIRGRLDDEAGRRYCEGLVSDGSAEGTTNDRQFLDQLTKDLCRRRLALAW